MSSNESSPSSSRKSKPLSGERFSREDPVTVPRALLEEVCNHLAASPESLCLSTTTAQRLGLEGHPWAQRAQCRPPSYYLWVALQAILYPRVWEKTLPRKEPIHGRET